MFIVSGMTETDEIVPKNPLELAIKLLGGVNKMGKRMNVEPSAITNWRRRGNVPTEQCPAIELLTRGKVKRKQLRPDMFASFEQLRRHKRQQQSS